MATFVLVHGAWHRGWCWQKLIPFLEAAGHDAMITMPRELAEVLLEVT